MAGGSPPAEWYGPLVSLADGTTFTIRIPVYAAPTNDPSQTHGPRR